MARTKHDEHLLYDKRLSDWFSRSGDLNQKMIEKHLKDLPDLAAEADVVPAYEEPGDEPTIEMDDSHPTFEAAT